MGLLSREYNTESTRVLGQAFCLGTRTHTGSPRSDLSLSILTRNFSHTIEYAYPYTHSTNVLYRLRVYMYSRFCRTVMLSSCICIFRSRVCWKKQFCVCPSTTFGVEANFFFSPRAHGPTPFPVQFSVLFPVDYDTTRPPICPSTPMPSRPVYIFIIISLVGR